MEKTYDRLKRWVDERDRGEGCWEWDRGRFTEGYGAIAWPLRLPPFDSGTSDTKKASRVAVFLDGRDPSGWVVRHKCDNPPCVNPDHLLLGTYADNSRDALDRGRVPSQRILTPDQVAQVRADPRSMRVLAKAFQVSRMTIWRMKQ